MKNLFALVSVTLAASVLSFSQTPQATPIADESLRLCIASVQTKQFETAVTDCGSAIKKSPAKFEGYQGRGIAYFNLKNNDAALADFTKAIELAPKNPQLLGLRGEFYANTQKFDLALADFNKLLELSPQNQAALYRRAQIYSRTGKKDLAVADLKAILAANPNQAEAKKALAQLETPSAQAQQPPAQANFYRSDKYKIWFQLPNAASEEKTSLSNEKVMVFTGKESEYGEKRRLYFLIAENPAETAARVKLLATEEGAEKLANLLITITQRGAMNFKLVEKTRVQIAGFNVLRISYTEDDLSVLMVPNPRILATDYYIPVPEQNRHYIFSIKSPLKNFEKWFGDAEAAINSFEILK